MRFTIQLPTTVGIYHLTWTLALDSAESRLNIRRRSLQYTEDSEGSERRRNRTSLDLARSSAKPNSAIIQQSVLEGDDFGCRINDEAECDIFSLANGDRAGGHVDGQAETCPKPTAASLGHQLTATWHKKAFDQVATVLMTSMGRKASVCRKPTLPEASKGYSFICNKENVKEQASLFSPRWRLRRSPTSPPSGMMAMNLLDGGSDGGSDGSSGDSSKRRNSMDQVILGLRPVDAVAGGGRDPARRLMRIQRQDSPTDIMEVWEGDVGGLGPSYRLQSISPSQLHVIIATPCPQSDPLGCSWPIEDHRHHH